MDVCDLSIDSSYDFFNGLEANMRLNNLLQKTFSKRLEKDLEFLRNVGLNYLSLNRSSATLSGGESQRIRLATQIGSNSDRCIVCIR